MLTTLIAEKTLWSHITGLTTKVSVLPGVDPAVSAARVAAAQAHTDAAMARQDAAVERGREHAFSEIKDWAKPIDDRIAAADDVYNALGQGTAQADKVVIPMLIKALVVSGSKASGLRMTQAEIQQAMAGGTKWEQLKQSLNSWSLDPQHQVFDAPQRQSMINLVHKVVEKSHEARALVNDYRARINDAPDTRTVNQLRGELDAALHASTDNHPAPASSPTDTKARAKAFLEGK